MAAKDNLNEHLFHGKLYHGTSAPNAKEIMKTGLNFSGEHVIAGIEGGYFTQSPETAGAWGEHIVEFETTNPIPISPMTPKLERRRSARQFVHELDEVGPDDSDLPEYYEDLKIPGNRSPRNLERAGRLYGRFVTPVDQHLSQKGFKGVRDTLGSPDEVVIFDPHAVRAVRTFKSE